MTDQTATPPRIRTSATTEMFDKAFARAQAKFEAAVKSNVNPAFRSKYADVSSVIDATLEHLNSEGIGVKQHPGLEYKTVGDGVEAFMIVTTRLTFKGQWEESDIAIPAVQRDRFDAQSCGSALTYACRYALQGIFVVRREDDDANTAAGRGSAEQAQDVGKGKAKAGKQRLEAGKATECLFYVFPEGHNGNYAEILNLSAYGSALNEVAQEGLRLVFKRYASRITAGGGALVPAEKMESLLQELADAGVQTKKLEAP
jgi:hypothetical protein